MAEEKDKDKYPEVLVDLREDLEELIIAQGLAPDQARLIAHTATEHVRERWGGVPVYFPKGQAYELELRDREIAKKWTGANKLTLCREYKISEQRLYQILSRLRAEQIAAKQLRMWE